MTIEIQQVTQEEFDAVRPHFEVKAKALGSVRRFVQQDGTWEDTKAKDLIKYSYDPSKYLKALINGETFIVAAGNVISQVLETVLPKAADNFPENFGTNDAHAVVDALFRTQPVAMHKPGPQAESFYSTEQFAFCFKLNPDMTVDKRVLRMDLYRMIQEEKEQHGKSVFTGGLMHLLKHFRYNGRPLSTDKGDYDLTHPTEIIGKILHIFFQTPLVPDKNSLLGYWPLDLRKNLKVVFFEEPALDVYFITSGYIEGIEKQKTTGS